MTNFLASIKDVKEAKIVSSANIDIIDLKNVNDGALGFVGLDFISEASTILSKYSLSVTMGNDMNPNNYKNIENIESVVNKNIDFVKIGLFEADLIDEHEELIQLINFNKTKPICVLFADKDFKLDNVQKVIDIGYHGIMIDTFHKNNKSLVEILEKEIIEKFINITEINNMFSGLSGSLKIEHINELKKLNPDFLGFRGQLCESTSDRKNLSIDMLNRVSYEIRLNS
tara:strand:+ start:461 stop:1144 length:684 start_codon:yes stop_codon:yes gene_type:complete